jgi:hypothetical protein
MRMRFEELLVSGSACGTPIVDGSVAQLEEMVEALGRLASAPVEPYVDDAVRVDRIAALERLQAAAFAVQAAEMARFADSQVAEQKRVGSPPAVWGSGSRNSWLWRAECHR